jgi:ethanolamine utilization microcompartment shell protein EutS
MTEKMIKNVLLKRFENVRKTLKIVIITLTPGEINLIFCNIAECWVRVSF